jgi:PAS domain S-box-containing protein
MTQSARERDSAYVAAQLRRLSPLLQQYAMGDFSENIPIPDEEDEFTELLVGLHLMVDDIREMLQAQEETIAKLRESEARFKGLFENSPDIVALADLNGTFLDINKVAPGYTKEDVIGSRFTEYLTPEQTTVFHDTLKKALETETPQGYEVDITNPQGRTFNWYNRISPIRTEGKISQVVINCTDITARKQAEVELQKYSEKLEDMVAKRTRKLQEAQAQLVRREKLAVLGQMAGSVGHELRTPLSTISNAAYYLNMVLGKPEEQIAEYLDIICSETRRAEKIIADLLDFSRTKSLNRQEIHVADVVTLVLEKHIPPNAIQVTIQIPDTLPAVVADPVHVDQVLSNLVTNACQAMPQGGTLTISAHNDGDMVALDVSDTGSGIEPEHLDKLFEPLFTTKPKGIGLGLAVCKNLIEANGGAITVESALGKGSVFTVALPVAGQEDTR